MMDENLKKEMSGGGQKKLYVLAAAVVVLVCVVGFLVFSGYGGLMPGAAEKITNQDQASDTLSSLGNDVSGIGEDLKDMGSKL